MKMTHRLVAICLTFVCVLAAVPAWAQNVGCMVYNNGLSFTEEELPDPELTTAQLCEGDA